MKNFAKIAKGAIAIAVLAVIVVVVIILIKPKDPLTGQEFCSLMEENGYSIVNAKDQFADFAFIEEAYLAIDDDRNYQIEFYVVDNRDSAKQFYASNKDLFEASEGDISSQNESSSKNYSKCSMIAEGQFKYICRIKDTVMYADVDEKYEDEVKDITKELGY